MSKKSIEEILGFNSARRAGRGSILPPKDSSILSESIRVELKNQWEASGRERARVLVKLTETTGKDIFLTGWDGENTFVGYEPEKGLGYISASRVLTADISKDWNSETTLGDIRQNLDEMDRKHVQELVKGLQKSVTKRAKYRRVNEAKNFLNKFLSIHNTPMEPMPQTEETKTKPKKKSDKSFSVETPGNYMTLTKDESFTGALNKFRKLSEGSSKDPDLRGLSQKIAEKKFTPRSKLVNPVTPTVMPDELENK